MKPVPGKVAMYRSQTLFGLDVDGHRLRIAFGCAASVAPVPEQQS